MTPSEAGVRSGEVRAGRLAVSLEQVKKTLTEKRAAAPAPDPSGFTDATFGAVIKGATFTNSGSMKVVMEIPYAEVDAFLPCRKAFEIELLATFRRR